MKKRILALLIAAVLILSMTACKSTADEEESAVSGDITAEDVVDSTPQTNEVGSNGASGDGNVQTPDTNGQETLKTDTDTEKTEPDKPKTDGTHKIVFDYGYDNKTDTQAVAGYIEETKPERDGYNFEGWYYGSEKWNFSEVATSDMTLTAKWSVITYSISYNLDGAVLSDKSFTSYTAEDAGKEFPKPSKAYRLFLGWSVSNGEKTVTSDTVPHGITGDIALTPIWDENTLVFGKYEQDGNKNATEDIEWIILRQEDGKALVRSKYALDVIPFSAGKSNWANSDIRKWLANTFYNKAFDDTEKQIILKSDITTDSNPEFNTFGGPQTEDFVFLLSYQEVVENMNSATKRTIYCTDYAKSKGIQQDSGACWWWLRTPGREITNAMGVCSDSTVKPKSGYNNTMTNMGVVPAMWIDMAKLG